MADAPTDTAPPAFEPALRLRSVPTLVSTRWRGGQSHVYWVMVALLVGLYLFVWLSHFQYIYGWIMDDYDIAFRKGMETTQDWTRAFGYYNALQPYFFVISYLPLTLPISLSSYPLPILGEQTGHFRFLLLCTVFMHAGILALWALFARIVAPPLISFLSLVLLVTSPTFTLWTPQPESRLLGMPFVLLALWLLVRRGDVVMHRSWHVAMLMFAVGSLFGLGQSIHYTSLYLIIPFCVVYWGLWLLKVGRRSAYWLNLLSFVAGCVWLQAALELVSYFVLHIPLRSGPIATLLALREMHSSAWTTVGNLELWRDWFLSQMGAPLLIACAAGLFVYARPAVRFSTATSIDPGLLSALTVVVGLGYLGVSGTMAFFRQTSVLQPLMFLLAAAGVVELARRVGRPRFKLPLAVALAAVVGAIPLVQSYRVFEADQGLGRVLNWVYSQPGQHDVAWLGVAWFGDSTSLRNPGEFERLPPDTWLISYYPWDFVHNHPSAQAYLDAVRPLAQEPSLYSTDTLRAELKGYGYNDFRFDPLLSQVRVTRVGDVVDSMQGKELQVRKVSADSSVGGDEPANVFDQDASSNGHTEWQSNNSPGQHWLAIDFAQPTPIGEVQVILPPTDKSTNRIQRMEIETTDSLGNVSTVWSGDGLAVQPVIDAQWPMQLLSSVRLVISAEAEPTGPTSRATIEEVVFPGYRALPPRR